VNQRALRPAIGALAVAVLALLLFAPALRNGFAYDDVPIILGDSRLPSFALGQIFTRGWWQDADLALYRPLTTLSFALDWALAPGSAAWFHFVNVLLHAATCVLVYLLLLRCFAAAPALVGGLVFAAHPVHVEAVANVVGRAELLSALFFFGACLVWVWQRPGAVDSVPGPEASADASLAPPAALEAGAAARARRGPWLAALLFMLALLSKESAIVLPGLLVLVDAATGALRLPRAGAYLRRNGLALSALAITALTYLGLRAAVLGALTPGRLDPTLEAATSTGARLLTALQAWPVWARVLFFPRQLLADYGPRILQPAQGVNAAVALGLALVATLVLGGMAVLWRGKGVSALALLWFPLTVLPVSNLIVPIGVLVAERTLYVPSFAVAMAAAGLATLPALAAGRANRLARAALATILGLCALRIVTRIPEWTSTDSIMLALVRDRPDSFRGHWHMARMARTQNQVQRAIAQYDTAIALWPHRQRLVLEAAGYAAEQRSTEHTLALARLAVRQWPDDVATQRLLAGAALDAGQLDTARRAIAAGLRVLPGDPILLRMAAAADSARARSR
jgi:tetratricopeptide (TPR) repeat protein